MKLAFVFIALLFFLPCANAQNIGAKVSFPGTDQRTYTGTIVAINGDQFKIKYDGYDFEAWVVRSQFTVINDNGNMDHTAAKTGNWQVGDKVEAYDIYNNKWENATITIVFTDRTPYNGG